MKNKLSMILIILLFVIGVGVMSYPFISDWVNHRSQAEIIEHYNEAVETLSPEEIQAELSRAEGYNKSLFNNVVLTDPFDEKQLKETTEEYMSLLNVREDGVMGYIEIPNIDVYLPVYHGTTSEVLAMGAGHLQGSSLPIGGTGTHSVISAHTGLPSTVMFDKLTDLVEGDVFYVTVLGTKCAYQVDSIRVVEPDNVSDLGINLEEDYVTLVTCTPYGVNSHRLLVRGTRIPYDPDNGENSYIIEGDNNYWIIVIIAVVVAAIVTAIIIHKKRKKYKNNKMSLNGLNKGDSNSEDANNNKHE